VRRLPYIPGKVRCDEECGEGGFGVEERSPPQKKTVTSLRGKGKGQILGGGGNTF